MSDVPDKLVKIIPASSGLWLWLYEAADQSGGSFISFRHTAKVRDMPGEIIITPGDIPEIVKALTSAALELERRAMYYAGVSDQESPANDC